MAWGMASPENIGFPRFPKYTFQIQTIFSLSTNQKDNKIKIWPNFSKSLPAFNLSILFAEEGSLSANNWNYKLKRVNLANAKFQRKYIFGPLSVSSNFSLSAKIWIINYKGSMRWQHRPKARRPKSFRRAVFNFRENIFGSLSVNFNLNIALWVKPWKNW